jgi:hypothetical protein
LRDDLYPTQYSRRLGTPCIVIFTRVARELAHNNPCEPLPKKSLDTHTLNSGCF